MCGDFFGAFVARGFFLGVCLGFGGGFFFGLGGRLCLGFRRGFGFFCFGFCRSFCARFFCCFGFGGSGGFCFCLGRCFFFGGGFCRFFCCGFFLGGSALCCFGFGFFCGFLRGFGGGLGARFFFCCFACGFGGLAAFFFFGTAEGGFFAPFLFFDFADGVGLRFGLCLLARLDLVQGVLQGRGINDLGVDDRLDLFAFLSRWFFFVEVDGVLAVQVEDEGEQEDADADACRATEVFFDDDAFRRLVFVHGLASAVPVSSGGCSVTRPTFGAPACCRRTMPSMTWL